MENTLSSAAGWIGMILLLTAYYLVSTKKLTGGSRLYQSLNFFGAIGIVYNTFVQQAWPAMALNIIWAIIALCTIVTVRKKRI